MFLRVLDVSEYQGASVNWQALAAQNISGGLAKVTEGAGHLDSCFTRNWFAIKEAGLARGLYHFCRFDLGNTPQQEANWLLRHLPALDGGDVIILDAELPAAGPGALDGPVIQTAELIERATGTTPWLYTGRWFAQGLGRFSSPDLARLPLFNAAYVPPWPDDKPPPVPSAYSPWGTMVCWQHTDRASYRGIGACDESLFLGPVEHFKSLGYPMPAKPPAPPPVLKHWELKVAMHLRPAPRVDAMPLGRLLPVGTRVVELALPGGGPIEQNGWAHTRTSGDLSGWLLMSNMRAYRP
jgi:lysozyme